MKKKIISERKKKRRKINFKTGGNALVAPFR
jgi:hypothetical protein